MYLCDLILSWGSLKYVDETWGKLWESLRVVAGIRIALLSCKYCWYHNLICLQILSTVPLTSLQPISWYSSTDGSETPTRGMLSLAFKVVPDHTMEPREMNYSNFIQLNKLIGKNLRCCNIFESERNNL